jgi:hypothetical protein
MPDHVYLVVWFPDVERRVQTIVSKWKEWTAKSLNIDWQRISSNIGFVERRASVKRLITFWQIQFVRAWFSVQRIGLTFSAWSRGRDGALRCPDAAARRPYLFAPVNSSTSGCAS